MTNRVALCYLIGNLSEKQVILKNFAMSFRKKSTYLENLYSNTYSTYIKRFKHTQGGSFKVTNGIQDPSCCDSYGTLCLKYMLPED